MFDFIKHILKKPDGYPCFTLVKITGEDHVTVVPANIGYNESEISVVSYNLAGEGHSYLVNRLRSRLGVIAGYPLYSQDLGQAFGSFTAGYLSDTALDDVLFSDMVKDGLRSIKEIKEEEKSIFNLPLVKVGIAAAVIFLIIYLWQSGWLGNFLQDTFK